MELYYNERKDKYFTRSMTFFWHIDIKKTKGLLLYGRCGYRSAMGAAHTSYKDMPKM